MLTPVASVVIPALNAEDTISEQLAAVLSQNFGEPYEVIVADNGSTDATRDIVSCFAAADRRVCLVDASDRPKGGAAAKNVGVSQAHADVILFTDADDVVKPGWLEAGYNALKRHPVVVFQWDVASLSSRASKIERKANSVEKVFWGVPTIRGGLFGIHRQLYVAVGGFSEAFLGAVDTEFGVRLYKHTRIRPHLVEDAVVQVRPPARGHLEFSRQREFAESHALIVSMHGDVVVVPARALRANLEKFGCLLIRSPMLIHRERRREWLRSAGMRLGRVSGFVRHGVLLP